MKHLNRFFYFLIFFFISFFSSAQNENWQAKWIGTPYAAGDTNIWTSFRKEIVLNNIPGTV
ncbi:MAG: hypothetical protein ABI288_02365, partial [Ginsengibacter sp.]